MQTNKKAQVYFRLLQHKTDQQIQPGRMAAGCIRKSGEYVCRPTPKSAPPRQEAPFLSHSPAQNAEYF
jgi:hypothetical protein